MFVILRRQTKPFNNTKTHNKMKKILSFALVAAAMLFAGKANAQLNVHVGYAPQTYKTTVKIAGVETESTADMNGFFAGADFNMAISGDLHLDLGANVRFNTKSDETSGVKTSSTQMLIDVPVLLNYGLNIHRDFRIAAFAGPAISFALSGNTNTEVLGVSTDADWYDGDNRSRFDLSVMFGVSVDFTDFRLFGGYNLGLLNTSKADNTTVKGSNWFVGLGYNL